ncbi:nucleotide sugar dehydrogenase [Candidatus Saganbacteria bacterium CG08_land_8_20_14_0_20_45_16]|uniref:Nucleotide sugar dehydrogenase n=1 Tax=Candidatus Saganbacteria bacterium CG08_land_8_20_14_0_20_45_16 TaxID=2014293 RepID=A0A2H0Y172_UNCSA|nr:MAG: nucleotide sugar dehydrogenase [Candidatus Saganbacteria bacterium CG08_land_8_20_14_0_20_45_16]
MKKLLSKIINKKAKIGIIGLGYVGLPLVREFLRVGFPVIGFDVDNKKVSLLNQGKSYIKHIANKTIKDFVSSGRFQAITNFSSLKNVDVVIICVPTPLNDYREPDLSYILETTKTIALNLKKGQLIVLESTTYPGTTDEVILPLLEQGSLKVGQDIFLAFSPEREDPSNKDFGLGSVPKVVGGITPGCLQLAQTLYDQIVVKTVPVSSPRVAEATKLLENIYRAVNIALVNELKMLFDRMQIDIFEVINAAKTKPFGFQAFYPGPGLGGHCIPIDPFYLTWKARQYDFATRFIELAGEINTNMPYYVFDKIVSALGQDGKSIKNARILVLGTAYKKDIDDQRESPALKIIDLLIKKKARVSYNDPNVPRCFGHQRFPGIDLSSTSLTPKHLKAIDCVVLVTNHSAYNYEFIAKHSKLIVDTRNAFGSVKKNKARIVPA